MVCFLLQRLLIFFFFFCSSLRVTYLCSLLKNHYRDMVLGSSMVLGSCYGATTVKFYLDFKIFSILCKLLNKYYWKFFFLCHSDLLNNSLSLSLSLCCSIALFFNHLFGKPKTDRNQLKPKYYQNRRFLTISVGFGWEFHKPKYSVSFGHTPTKPTEPNRAHP